MNCGTKKKWKSVAKKVERIFICIWSPAKIRRLGQATVLPRFQVKDMKNVKVEGELFKGMRFSTC